MVAACAGAVVASVVALLWLWAASSPWNDPVAPLLVFAPVPVVAGWLVVRGGVDTAGRVVAAVVVAACMAATVAVSVSGVFAGARIAGPLDAMATAASGILDGAPVPAEGCGAPPVLDYGTLGEPTEVCVVTYDIQLTTGEPASIGALRVAAAVDQPASDAQPVRQVRFVWASPGGSTGGSAGKSEGAGPERRELVYEGAVAQPPAGRCVRKLDGNWWAWTREAGGCPRAFSPSSG